MSATTGFLLVGLAVGAVGALVFAAGTRLMDRPKNRGGAWASCLLAILGALIVFVGFGIAAASMFAQ